MGDRFLLALHCLEIHSWSSLTQVAQLGEQQVQGCTARITHLETDLLHQVDRLKQQHDDQASSLAGVKADLEQLNTPKKSAACEQLAAQLSRLDTRVTDLQTAAPVFSQGKAFMQLEQDVNVLQEQMQQVHNSHASQQKTAGSLAELERDLASVKAAMCDSDTSKHSAECTMSGLQQELVALKEQLTQVSKSHAQEASTTRQPMLKLERAVAELSEAVLQLESQAAGQHAAAEAFKALQHDMADLKAEVAQLLNQHSSAKSHEDLYSSLERDVAATKDQLSSLRTELTEHAGQDSWQEESQKLRSELAACLAATSSTEAIVARHGSELSRMDSRLAELHAELSTASETRGQAQSGSQSEVEELNERLFELRVEVQNLTEDTGITIASMTRKVRPLITAATVHVA